MKKSRSPHTQPGAFDPLRRTAEDCERSHRRILRRVWIGFGAAAFGLGVMMWSADVISFEDERTIYTADCLDGEWKDGHCTGRLRAADRICFHASRDRSEVVYWKLGAPQHVERIAACAVLDGRNWSCAPADETRQPVPLTLVKGHV